MEVKVIKRYLDKDLKEFKEKGVTFEVEKERGEYLISRGVAKLIEKTSKSNKKEDDNVQEPTTEEETKVEEEIVTEEETKEPTTEEETK